MIVFPNCKINLGLRVLRKREDGFHDLETIFLPLPVYDALEIITTESSRLTPDHALVQFSHTGLEIARDQENNLCLKAYHLLKKDFVVLPAVRMHLHKAIPMGAGLGGGSSDGAFTLRLLNEKYKLGITKPDLVEYAVRLGSDCPFFIVNKPCFATSRGEMLEEIDLDLSAYKIVLVNPGIHVNTAWAFSKIIAGTQQRDESICNIIQQPVNNWKDNLLNDFETPVFEQHPEIKAIKDHLYNMGASYASMSGSGSTVFGIFEKEHPLDFNFPLHYTIIHPFPSSAPLR